MGNFYGLSYFTPGDSLATKLEDNNSFAKPLACRIYHIFEDRNQNVWVSSANGLYQLDIEKGLVARYATDEPGHFLPANEIRFLHQDADGIFWIASYDGLIRWDKENDKHRLFTTEDGLSNNHIMAVYEDDFGFLWLSSDNGIMQFEKSTQRVKVYLPEDGITHREFNRASYHKDVDGNLYFGSLNGITSFHPKDFVDRFYEEPNTPLLLTACKVVSGKTGKMESRLAAFQHSKEIVLEPGDRHLQLKFALLDYANNNPNVIQYVYSIDENEELNIGNESGINFDGLAYGYHLLKIKGRTSNGLFSKHTLNVPIVVLKPFYLQSWFLLLSFIAFVSLLFLFQKAKTRSLVKRQEELEALVQKRTRTIAAQATELRELDQAKSRFLANISHEFRTPLTLILNTLRSAEVKKLIQSSEQLSFSNTEVDIMGRNAERLEQPINQLLDLSTLESKKMRLNPRPGDFSFYLGQLLESFFLLAKKKEILIEYNNSLTQRQYNFDRDKMDKILYNLLSNAIKFTPKKGRISVKIENSNNEVVLKIKDSGIGIPEESKALIFDRFYQVNAGERFDYEGTGLGLALVKELVDLHQGNIDVESREGEGTTFTISLPLEEIAGPPMHSIAVRPKVFDPEIKAVDLSLSPANINLVGAKEKPVLLIIEDNEDLLYHHQKTFANSYKLILSKHGKEGVEKAFEYIPDLIICDVMLPGKNGFHICKELKTDERTNHIPIILLTARAHHEAKLNGLESGADAYLTKPYHQEELALRLNNLLLQKQRLQKQYKSNWKEAAAVAEVTTPDQVFMKKCEAILEKELTNRIFGVEEWSAAVGMTRVTLFRKMKSITGQTPSGYIRKYRLEKAKDLLLQSAGNASEVGYMVGFNKPSYFFKCFKDEYGMTVGEFVQTFVTKV